MGRVLCPACPSTSQVPYEECRRLLADLRSLLPREEKDELDGAFCFTDWGDPLALPGEFMLRQTLAELGASLLHDADVAGGASETRARERHRQIDHRDARRNSACFPHLRPVEEIRKLMLETVHRVSGDKRLRGGEPEFSFDMGWWGMENCSPCGILGDPSPRDSAYLPAKTARSDTLRRQAEYLWGPCVAVGKAPNLGHVGTSRGC